MAMATRDMITASDPDSDLCTDGGAVDHDYRPYAYVEHRLQKAALRCVWCHVVACGDVGDVDPCIEPYQHQTPHRTRRGVTWARGSNRP